MFLATKFTEGAWVVVVAVPLIMFMFTRVHAYYQRAEKALEIGQVPDRPAAKPTIVVVPVTGVSRLAEQAISEALGISKQVVAVKVVLEDAGAATGDGGSTGGVNEGSPEAAQVHALEQEWIRWGPGVPLRVLRTEYASVVRPIVAFIDDLRQRNEEQIMVLVPVAVPERLRYLFLHNHLEVVLDRALRGRTDVVIARVQVPLHAPTEGQQDERDDLGQTGTDGQAGAQAGTEARIEPDDKTSDGNGDQPQTPT